MVASNWARGTKGFLSNLDTAQQGELMLVLSQNDWKLLPARKMLEQRYDTELNDRTLGRYKKDLKSRWDNSDSGIDKSADWADFPTLAEKGVPTQHLRELHQMSQKSEQNALEAGMVVIKETYRMLRWQGYVIEYYGDVVADTLDRQYVAAMYSLREMADALFKVPMVRDDLDKWLRYRPWEGGSQEALYLRYVEEGSIPNLDLSSTQKASLAVAPGAIVEPDRRGYISVENKQGLTMNMIVSFAQGVSPPYYLLPSQIDMVAALNRWRERRAPMTDYWEWRGAKKGN